MKFSLFSTTVAAIALLSATTANADGYNTGVVTKTPSEVYTPVEFGSGWYIRGDLTYNFRGESNSSSARVTGIEPDYNVQTQYDDAVGVQVGFGNRIHPNFRLETTAEAVFNSTFSGFTGRGYAGQRDVVITRQTAPGSLTADPPVQPTFTDFTDTVFFDADGNVTGTTTGEYTGSTIAPIAGTERVDASYDAVNFLVSGYVDLPEFSVFQPYVGAGAGVSRIKINESRTFNCIPGSAETCGGAFGGAQGAATETTLTRDTESWEFAYQLSAGTGIRLDERTQLDVGYSFLSVANGDEITYSDGTAVNEDGFTVHQVKVGIRYELW